MRARTWLYAAGLAASLGLATPLALAGGKCPGGKDNCSDKDKTAPAPKPSPKMKSPARAGGRAGVSVGGAQDIGYARKLIASGRVPSPEAFAAEGLFSEHDFALPEGECGQTFCLRPDAAAIKIYPESEEGVLLQLGLDSGVELASFRREPLNLVVVLDRSGSMGGEKIAAARAALDRLVDKMTDDDRLGVVLFDDRVDVLATPEKMTAKAREALKRKIAAVEARGSTDIDSGLRKGYELAAEHAGKRGVSDRVMLFTDAMPNVGPTDADHFAGLVKKNGEAGIGATMFGVGVDFGYAIADTLSAVRGANYVFLESPEKLEKVFDEDFDFLVTPIAHDFALTLEPGPGYELGEVFGIPRAKAAAKAELKVATLFLSKEKGAIAVRLSKKDAAKAGAEVAYLALSYTPVGGAKVHETASAKLSREAGPGVRKLAALVSMATTLKQACRDFTAGKAEAARELVAPLAEALKKEAKALKDDSLRVEADLVEKLAKNFGAPVAAVSPSDDL
jgi:Ca-activated chloride channel homolog